MNTAKGIANEQHTPSRRLETTGLAETARRKEVTVTTKEKSIVQRATGVGRDSEGSGGKSSEQVRIYPADSYGQKLFLREITSADMSIFG
jgi:hypothetical protein